MEKLRVIASYPKSGNTWLRLMLYAFASNGLSDINQIAEEGFCAKDDADWIYRLAYGFDVEAITDHQAQKLRYYNYDFLRRFFALRNAHPFVKTHCINGVTDEPIPAPYINWGDIHSAVVIVRNPLDVCCSLADHIGTTTDDAADCMGQDVFRLLTAPRDGLVTPLGSWSRWVASWTTHNPYKERCLAVRYEDLPDRLGEIAHHFDLEGAENAELISLAVRDAQIERLAAQEKDHGFHEKSPKSASSFFGGKRPELTDYACEKIIEDHREIMERFGYLEAMEDVA